QVSTLSLHDALPISLRTTVKECGVRCGQLDCLQRCTCPWGLRATIVEHLVQDCGGFEGREGRSVEGDYSQVCTKCSTIVARRPQDRKSTRLNSSHQI